MNHFILFIICFLSIELFIKLNFSGLVFALLNLMKKVVHIISNKYISDHWKESIVPKYSIKMMILSLRILLIFSIIILLFVTTNIFQVNLLNLVFQNKEFSNQLSSAFFLF